MTLRSVARLPFAVAGRAPKPWKNGMGVTRELALEPVDAGLDHFDWRVTVAEIVPGRFRFSLFPGMERRTIVTRPGLRVGTPGESTASRRDVVPWTVLPLAGEEPLDAVLEGLPVQAFNLMFRRGAASGTVAVHRAAAPLEPADATVLWCVQGTARVDTGNGTPLDVNAGQALCTTGEDGSGTMRLDVADDRVIVLAALIHDHRIDA